jgi:hypothetical protein
LKRYRTIKDLATAPHLNAGEIEDGLCRVGACCDRLDIEIFARVQRLQPGISPAVAFRGITPSALISVITYSEIHRLAVALDPDGPPFLHELLEAGVDFRESGLLQALVLLSLDPTP